MPIILPEPTPSGDIWGGTLNTAILAVEATAEAAQADAATNVSVEGVDSDGNPVLSYGASTATVLLASQVGAESGAAALDSASQVPSQELGQAGHVVVGAAGATHQHQLSDIPAAVHAINEAPAVATFNTGSSKWPRRIDVTSSPTRMVIWWGDAELPSDALPGVDFFLGPRASTSTVVAPASESAPAGTIDANGVTLATPVVVVNGSNFSVSALVTVSALKYFPYLHINVRGPSGENRDTAFFNDRRIATTQTLLGSGNASTTGTWKAYLSYNLTGGPTGWINGPSVSFSVATTGGAGGTPGTGTPGSGSVPLAGRSGLTWNSGITDASEGQRQSADRFGVWRNRPLDVISYYPGLATWDEMTWLRDDLTAWPGYRMVTLSTQPEGQSNSDSAIGANNAFWIEYGLNLKNAGWDDGRTIIRINPQGNGTWYDWSWGMGGTANFVSAIQNAVTSIKVNAPKTKFVLSLARGEVIGVVDWTTAIADPLVGYLDMIGIDSFDHDPAQTDQTAWDSALAEEPGFTSVANYCRAKGLKMAITEWGLSDGVTGSFVGGGDDVFYIGKVFSWMNANNDVVALETYFNRNTSSLNQQIFPVATKPLGSAAYKATDRWGA